MKTFLSKTQKWKNIIVLAVCSALIIGECPLGTVRAADSTEPKIVLSAEVNGTGGASLKAGVTGQTTENINWYWKDSRTSGEPIGDDRFYNTASTLTCTQLKTFWSARTAAGKSADMIYIEGEYGSSSQKKSGEYKWSVSGSETGEAVSAEVEVDLIEGVEVQGVSVAGASDGSISSSVSGIKISKKSDDSDVTASASALPEGDYYVSYTDTGANVTVRAEYEIETRDAAATSSPSESTDPSSSPSADPSSSPSTDPSSSPSADPSSSPSADPSSSPSADPSSSPSTDPSSSPSADPSTPPSTSTVNPTTAPGTDPVITPANPTDAPTTKPSIAPTKVPEETVKPTGTPAIEPTIAPTAVPEEPTKVPVIEPSKAPVIEPSKAPADPTKKPAAEPSKEPETKPSAIPNMKKAGTSVTVGKIKYKSLGSKSVSYAGTKTSKKTVKVPDTVTVNGIKYKVTTVEPKAFVGTKIKEVTLGKNITTVSSQAFKGCKQLTKVKFSNKVKTISGEAFSGCTKLKSVSLPSSVTTIGTGAFKNCKSLTKLKIGDKPKKLKGLYAAPASTKVTIGARALQNCVKLKSVIINSQVTKIGNGTFQHCQELAKVLVRSMKLREVGNKALKGVSDCKISVPSVRLRKYRTLFKNKGQGRKVVIAKV